MLRLGRLPPELASVGELDTALVIERRVDCGEKEPKKGKKGVADPVDVDVFPLYRLALLMPPRPALD